MDLKNKITLVTGASAGIGRAIAEEFAAAGSDLILLARRKQMIDELAGEIREKYGANAITYGCDVRNYDMVSEVINSIPENFASIDILVNNAGLARGLTPIQEGVLSDWEEMIDTNIKGLLYVSRLIIPAMVRRGKGMVINIASIAGRQIYPKGNVYCATKSAAKFISESMVVDLNGTGVRVCNIDPGLVETEFSLVRFHGDSERAAGVYRQYTPLAGRDIAEIALFAATRPAHVMIQDIMVTPTDQANVSIVHKK